MSYYTKITKAGLAAITAAMSNSSKVPITYMAFGDGNGYIPEPDENATSLVNEVYRVGVNKVEVHSKNPNWLVCEAIIPSAVGGFNIREVALYDQTGSIMLAVASYPPTYKPSVEEGAAKIQTIRIVIQVDNSGNFELIIDPDVVLATASSVNDLKKELYEKTIFSVETLSDLLQLDVWEGRTVQIKSYSQPNHALLNAYRGGGEFVYVTSRANENDDGTIINGWVRTNIFKVDPCMFGAEADGNADDSMAFTKSIASGFDLHLGSSERIYKVNQSLNLLPNQKIYGGGAAVTSNSAIQIFKLANNCQLDQVKFINSEIVVGQSAISINNQFRTKVTGCHFEKIDTAYYVTNTVDKHQGNIFSNNSVTLCTIGLNLDTRAEYTSITGNNIDQCTTGVRIKGGNTNITGGCISDCATAVSLVSGSNDAHGRVTGTLINHNVIAVSVDSTSVEEFHFDDCSFYYGNVYLKNSNGIHFKDCTLSTITLTFENSFENYFQDCFFYNMPTLQHRYNNTQSETIFIDCHVKGELGTSSAHMNGGYLSATLGSPSQQVPINSEFIVKFTNLTNCLSFDTQFTNKFFYDISTGFTKNLNTGISAHLGWNINVDLKISVGFPDPNITDYDNLHVVIVDSDGNIAAIAQPSQGLLGALSNSYKTYTFSGNLLRNKNYAVKVINNSSIGAIVYYHQPGAKVPSILTVTNI